MASDLPFYDIYAPQKVSLSKNFDDVIARDLSVGPPIKNPSYAYALAQASFWKIRMIFNLFMVLEPVETISLN